MPVLIVETVLTEGFNDNSKGFNTPYYVEIFTQPFCKVETKR